MTTCWDRCFGPPPYGLLPEEAILDTLPGITVATFETPSRGSRMDPAGPCRYPQAAGRVVAEAALLPADPAATTSTHLDGLRYTQALVREVLRLHPPAGYSPGAPRDRLSSPATPSTRVHRSRLPLHRSPRRPEHSDPDQFQPERWLDASGSPTKPGVFLSFQTGPHGCEGAALAMAMLTLLTAQTARRYQLSEPPGPEPSYQVTTLEGLATVGLRLRATLRS